MAKRPIYAERWSWPLFLSDVCGLAAGVMRQFAVFADHAENQLTCSYYQESEDRQKVDAKTQAADLLSALDDL